jgi:hypothetical protein
MRYVNALNARNNPNRIRYIASIYFNVINLLEDEAMAMRVDADNAPFCMLVEFYQNYVSSLQNEERSDI